MSNHRYGLRTASGNIKDILQEDSLQVGRVLRSRTRINQGDVFFSDLFQPPTAVYTLRKLNPSAINCIRVRRSNDNAEQDIGFINSKPNAPLNTGQLMQFVGANDGFVVTWYDQSGLNRDAEQTTGANQPQIVNSGSLITENGLPTIEFNGTSQSLQIADFQTAAYVHVNLFSVLRFTGTTGTHAIFAKFATTGNNRSIYIAIINNVWDTRISANGTSTVIRYASSNNPPSGQQIFTNINDLSQSTNADRIQFYRNGTNTTKTAINANNITSAFNANVPFFIGANGTIGASNLFVGNMQEIIFYDTAKASQRIAIETNQNNYYNVF
jgi:hypothetical protein